MLNNRKIIELSSSWNCMYYQVGESNLCSIKDSNQLVQNISCSFSCIFCRLFTHLLLEYYNIHYNTLSHIPYPEVNSFNCILYTNLQNYKIGIRICMIYTPFHSLYKTHLHNQPHIDYSLAYTHLHNQCISFTNLNIFYNSISMACRLSKSHY